MIDIFLTLDARRRQERATLTDRPRKRHSPIPASVRGNLMHNTASTGTLSHQRDALGIAAEFVDMRLYPLERKALVEKAEISRPTLGGKGWTGEETEGAETIVERNVDDAFLPVTLGGGKETDAAAISRFPREGEAAAMEPDHAISNISTETKERRRRIYTAAPFPPPLHSKISLGTSTSKNKQSSLVPGTGGIVIFGGVYPAVTLMLMPPNPGALGIRNFAAVASHP